MAVDATIVLLDVGADVFIVVMQLYVSIKDSAPAYKQSTNYYDPLRRGIRRDFSCRHMSVISLYKLRDYTKLRNYEISPQPDFEPFRGSRDALLKGVSLLAF